MKRLFFKSAAALMILGGGGFGILGSGGFGTNQMEACHYGSCKPCCNGGSYQLCSSDECTTSGGGWLSCLVCDN